MGEAEENRAIPQDEQEEIVVSAIAYTINERGVAYVMENPELLESLRDMLTDVPGNRPTPEVRAMLDKIILEKGVDEDEASLILAERLSAEFIQEINQQEVKEKGNNMEQVDTTPVPIETIDTSSPEFVIASRGLSRTTIVGRSAGGIVSAEGLQVQRAVEQNQQAAREV
jgi:hypothetical protein